MVGDGDGAITDDVDGVIDGGITEDDGVTEGGTYPHSTQLVSKYTNPHAPSFLEQLNPPVHWYKDPYAGQPDVDGVGVGEAGGAGEAATERLGVTVGVRVGVTETDAPNDVLTVTEGVTVGVTEGTPMEIEGVGVNDVW